MSCPASFDTVKAFLGWLELTGMSAQVHKYLSALGRMQKEKGLENPVEDFRIKEVVRGIKLLRAQDHDAEWPRDPFPLEALRWCHDNPPEKVNLIMWCRDLVLVAIGFRMMQRPGELCKLRLKDVERRSGLI